MRTFEMVLVSKKTRTIAIEFIGSALDEWLWRLWRDETDKFFSRRIWVNSVKRVGKREFHLVYKDTLVPGMIRGIATSYKNMLEVVLGEDVMVPYANLYHAMLGESGDGELDVKSSKKRRKKRREFRLIVDIPDGALISGVQEHIARAVKTAVTTLPPSNPISKMDCDTVEVKRIRAQRS